jgi:hypothetical protein
MPVDLRFFGPGLDTTITVMNNSNDQSFTFTTQIQPDSIQLDPQGWILKDIQRIPTGVDIIRNLPRSLILYQNYPNPFNPTTEINFQIAKDGFVNLKIYDVLGREVATIVSEKLQPGYYSRQWDASAMPTGIYFYRLSIVPLAQRDLIPTYGRNEQVDGLYETKKMVLIR